MHVRNGEVSASQGRPVTQRRVRVTVGRGALVALIGVAASTQGVTPSPASVRDHVSIAPTAVAALEVIVSDVMGKQVEGRLSL